MPSRAYIDVDTRTDQDKCQKVLNTVKLFLHVRSQFELWGHTKRMSASLGRGEASSDADKCREGKGG